jgi:hypothetical protein
VRFSLIFLLICVLSTTIKAVMDCEPVFPSQPRSWTPTASAAPGSTRPQPRKQKPAGQNQLPGIKKSLPNRLSVDSIKKRLRSELSLEYTPDDWQARLIRRVLLGCDSILCAGTGYGKSLVFEGLANLGGRKKVVVVICPLKATRARSGTSLYIDPTDFAKYLCRLLKLKLKGSRLL